MNKPNKVILHCSDSPDLNDNIGAAQIKEWHLERGFNDIGYHFIIRRSGIIEVGRKEETIGAHTKGFNTNSLGICLVGKRNFTTEQVSSLKVLYKDILNKHKIDFNNWHCHYEFANKTCPNIPIAVLKELLRLSNPSN